MIGAIRLPRILQHRLEAASRDWLHPIEGPAIDFAKPAGEEALASADSVSWRIFKNPVALFIGGVAAVLMELAQPAVRTGVWQHSTFSSHPLRRLRRTGLAAMITVYGPRSIAEPMIARVTRMHSKISGLTSQGVPYSANDGDLLTWVHATAAFGFASAYARYAEPLDSGQLDAYYLEGLTASRLYGATHAPRTHIEVQALFDAMETRLEPSPIIVRFLQIMHETPALPATLSWLQPSLVRAAVGLIPESMRHRLQLGESHGPSRKDRWLAALSGAAANRVMLQESPAIRSCLRLGLPSNHLYR